MVDLVVWSHSSSPRYIKQVQLIDKTNRMSWAPSVYSDKPGHPPDLTCVTFDGLKTLGLLM